MKKGFTGNKHLDMIVLNNLSDDDLFRACQTDTTIANICRDDLFWARRLQQKYQVETYKPYKSWKELYIFALIHEKYGKYLGSIRTIAREKPFNVTTEKYYGWLNEFNDLLKLVNQQDDPDAEIFKDNLDDYPGLYFMAFLVILFYSGHLSIRIF